MAKMTRHTQRAVERAPRVKAAASLPAAVLARKQPNKKPRKHQARRPGIPIQTQVVLTGLCLALLTVGLPTALMLTIALPPTFCAFLAVHRQGYYVALSIGALNIAGIWPFLLKLWTTGHTVSNAMQIIIDPLAWLIIYGAAAAGWVLSLWFPVLVSAYMSMFTAHRLKDLQRQQQKLVEEWGPEVANHRAADDL